MSTVSTQRVGRRAKGELARERLKNAAIAVLDRAGYHQLRIKDVTAEAGVAAGLFHHYYSDLRSLVEEILEEHIAKAEATEVIERDVSKGDWFNRLRSHYRFAVRNHAEHPGIMRCIHQFCADDPDFRKRWNASYYKRLELLVDVFPFVFPDSELSADEARLIVYGLSGIGQDLLREYYIERDSPLLALQLSEEELAEWLAVLQYRSLFACNPPKEQLRYASRILTIKRHSSSPEHSDQACKGDLA
ncbi:TetR/AcrR family transcriptional regulator [Parahaliea sp. F7430]|uniref:TetR/AcrR family transcriptional regulator n=1 Tax=Sediminihaliea albiluteola TaxID=2758564 RepID=A0A7W2TW48_9GAMM|nr:TetR/AcrR family transcriptional regulator [Sediminihaliea albiluteola]MBA6413055.1 TetR/AcrR family transcriptional regulator [Sediminihaliea albiluteola]